MHTSVRYDDFFRNMLFLTTIYFTVYVLSNTGKTNGFLMHGNPNMSTGHNTETKEVMQILQNQTTELENLKQKSVNDTLQIKLLQKMTANEGNDLNVIERLNAMDTCKHLNDLDVKFRYTSLSLLDIHTMAEKINGSMLQLIEKINGHDRSTIKLLLNQSIELENLKGEVENYRFTQWLNLLFNQSNELESLKQKVEKDAVNIDSNQDFIENMTINREMDKNVTKRLKALEKHLIELKVQFRSL